MSGDDQQDGDDFIDPYTRFTEELDDFVDRWRKKPGDDQLSVGQCCGALLFVAHNLMQDAREQHHEKED